MPIRNRVKVYGEDQYYHVYNRGVNKDPIFLDDSDYSYFLSLFKRYLSPEEASDNYRHLLKNYSHEIELIAYCLMPNHYHLLIYLKDTEGLVHLMRSIMTAYTMYFNKKYKRVGSLYQGIFLASRITSDEYLWHISRYIHLNPLDIGADYFSYSYSSLGYYGNRKHALWIHPERLIKSPNDRDKYMMFLSDYESIHDELNIIKHLLADQ